MPIFQQIPNTWVDYTPVVTTTSPAGSGFQYTINSARYWKVGRTVCVSIDVTITNLGTTPTASGVPLIDLPFNSSVAGAGCGRENNLTGHMLQAIYSAGGTQLTVYNYLGSTPLDTNCRLRVSATYESTT